MIDHSLAHMSRTESFVTKIFASLFFIAGMIHIAMFFGWQPEKDPYILSLYFNSLSFFDIAAAIGLFMRKPWGVYLAALIATTQIPAHLYMIALDKFYAYGSGFSIGGRIVDIVLITSGVIFFRKFFNRDQRMSHAS